MKCPQAELRLHYASVSEVSFPHDASHIELSHNILIPGLQPVPVTLFSIELDLTVEGKPHEIKIDCFTGFVLFATHQYLW